MEFELIATATFGLEAVVRREIEALGYYVVRTENGKVTFAGDERSIARANIWLRTADRVLLKMSEFTATTFEELFDNTTSIPWEKLIPPDGKFTVTCSTVKSGLHNPPAIQSITKKAIVERLKKFYNIEHFKETGAEYTVKVSLLKDIATLTVDTSGRGLHKRGYRVCDVAAPIKETMAAALVELSFWHENRVLIDPCCGSGTIPIEAAMIGKNIAPGLNRKFAAQEWELIDKKIWQEERDTAIMAINTGRKLKIFAGDIDPAAVAAAEKNAKKAGVYDSIVFTRADVRALKTQGNSITGSDRHSWLKSGSDNCLGENAVIVTNLPYGHRIGDEKAISDIYRSFKDIMADKPGWSLFALTSDKKIERALRRKADRRRKLYNGAIEAIYYQFHGEKPVNNTKQ